MATSRPSTPLRVAVASDQSLVAEAVRAALAGRGFEARTLRWPGAVTSQPRDRPTPPFSPEAGILISDLDRWPRVRAVRLMLANVRTRWVVLTAAPRGPMWGACLEAGAELVLPSSTSLDEVALRLPSLVEGELTIADAERVELVEEWTRLQEQREDVAARMRALTPREREVLGLLYAGESVVGIAEIFDVSPATVRSQVKAVLRKLDVNNQLGAVAALGSLLEFGLTDLPDPPS